MGFKRIIGILLIIIGAVFIGISIVGNKKLAEGTLEIANAKGKVKTTDQVFSLSPYTQPIGKGISGNAQGKISAAEDTVAYYTMIFQWCKWGGIAVAAIGLLMVIFGAPKRQH